MIASPFHILIIGGGLGGLCLAQGLKQAGISVAVYERDRTPNDRLQGYRIHIEPQGNRALAACLPADLFNTYRATSGPGGNGFRLSTAQLKELCFFRAPAATTTDDPAALDLSVSRISLRQILLSGLDEVIHFDKTFTHYEELPDGTIKAYFDDGTSAVGDVLVAADGVRSRVRQQFLPHAQTVETGVVAVMGKLALTDEARMLLVPGQFDGATSILGPHGHAMFVALHELGNPPAAGADGLSGDQGAMPEAHPGLLFDNQSDYLFWAFIARQEKYPGGEAVRQLDGVALRQVVLEMIQTWHPRLQEVVGKSDHTTIIAKPLHTSAPIKPWATKRVSLVGDAIHSMPPTRGIGGNTALRDAQRLCEQLIAARSGEKSILQAIHDYEVEMIKEGGAAVRSSMQALQLHVAERRLVTTALLRTMNAFLQHRRQRQAA
jgi:salicylate hydroxylase